MAQPQTVLHRQAAAIETWLRAAFPAPTFTIDLMPAMPTKAEFASATRVKPFIGIAWGDFKTGKQARALDGDAEWIVYLVCENKLSAAARLRGDARGIGLFGMVTAAGAVLHGRTLEGVGSTAVTGAAPIWKEEWGDDATAIAMVSLTFGCGLGPDRASDQSLTDFLRLTCAWAMPGAEGALLLPTDTTDVRG